MRLPVSKLRLMMYLCGAAVTTATLAYVTQKIPDTFAENETTASGVVSDADIENADPDDNPTGAYESHPDRFVMIYDQGNTLQIKTSAITVREALERAKIDLAETDKVEPSLTDQIDADDFRINIYRSRPVMIIDGAVKKRLMTASYDPATIAENAGLTIYDGDTIELVKNANFLEAGDLATYKITRNGGRTVTIEQAIPFSEETIQDSSLASGEKEVRQVGEDGRRVLRYRVNFIDGVEVFRELIADEVAKEPVNKITAVGSKKSIAPEWATCQSYAKQAGVSDADMYAALTLIYHESGCRVDASNASSGAYGIPQALPGSKMASVGSDWQTNPVTQIRWMAQYVTRRYGGWQQALDFWWCTGTCNGVTKSSHWY